MSMSAQVEVVTDEVVCAACGKKVVIRSRKLSYEELRKRPLHPPIDGMFHRAQCPDGCEAGLTRVECRGVFVRPAA